jgi:LysR family transcriptional activator of nhaA
MKGFGQAGLGVFPVPSVIAEEVMLAYNVESIGCAQEAVIKYFAISRERTLKHPAVVAVHRTAKRTFVP